MRYSFGKSEKWMKYNDSNLKLKNPVCKTIFVQMIFCWIYHPLTIYKSNRKLSSLLIKKPNKLQACFKRNVPKSTVFYATLILTPHAHQNSSRFRFLKLNFFSFTKSSCLTRRYLHILNADLMCFRWRFRWRTQTSTFGLKLCNITVPFRKVLPGKDHFSMDVHF